MQKLGNSNEDLRHEEKKAYVCRSTAEVAAGFSGSVQVDAAARVGDGDEARRRRSSSS